MLRIPSKLEVLGRYFLQSKIQSGLAICPFVAHIASYVVQARSDCHHCYQGVNRDVLHSASRSRKSQKVALANAEDSFKA